MDTIALRQTLVRRLAREDLDAVVAIDALAEGRSRRPYFERRLAAALREPAWHVQFACTGDGGLAGYVLARVLEGEFGRAERALLVEAIGARHDARGAGVGRRLLEALAGDARRLGVTELRTQAAWNDHRMLRWLDENGFALAAGRIVDRAVPGFDETTPPDASAAGGDEERHEIAYGAAGGDDFARLARDVADIRAMEATDLADVVRIDRAITGGAHDDYMRRKLAEAMLDSAVRVSLTARVDGTVVGFVMARVDLGDFGRTEPAAVLDTIGVHPDYAHRRIGHALLSQLFANLGALCVERVETMVAPRDLALLGFLYDAGFAPSQRIAFIRPLSR
jgi:ribosomal protein S18 acetylase RimI-like enzyme